MTRRNVLLFPAAAALLGLASTALAQFPPAAPVISPQVQPDRKLTFRIRAAQASAVRLTSSDIPELGRGAEMRKGENGVWEVTVGPVPAGAYRYSFDVGGVPTTDPGNPLTSESNANTWSLVHVPGAELFDTGDVPHGSIAEVLYASSTLKRPRRAHVYTPPGYESGKGEFPVLYLLHGAFDSDDSWSTVGRAGFILDHLIAQGKARPMIVVMPTGHTGRFTFGAPNALDRQVDEFSRDFLTDLKPYIEKSYRLRRGRAHTALAGLSMGGAQTLNIAIPNLKDYGYVGVFSSGVFGIEGRPGQPRPQFEEGHKNALDNSELKKGLKLVWFATGKDDFLLETTRATVKMLQGHGFNVVYRETDGGHTWLKWRDYLAEFAPLLFQR